MNGMDWKDFCLGVLFGWMTMFIFLISVGAYIEQHKGFLN